MITLCYITGKYKAAIRSDLMRAGLSMDSLSPIDYLSYLDTELLKNPESWLAAKMQGFDKRLDLKELRDTQSMQLAAVSAAAASQGHVDVSKILKDGHDSYMKGLKGKEKYVEKPLEVNGRALSKIEEKYYLSNMESDEYWQNKKLTEVSNSKR